MGQRALEHRGVASLKEPSLAIGTVRTPVGELTVVASAQGVRQVRWHGEGASPHEQAEPGATAQLGRTLDQIEEYFRGERQAFDLDLDLQGTEFQRLVWQELARIPFGETRNYGTVAKAVGRPAAARAVGAATGRNPAPLVVPCHRVVGASGSLTGFAGGLEAKRILLAHEARVSGKRDGRLPGF